MTHGELTGSGLRFCDSQSSMPSMDPSHGE